MNDNAATSALLSEYRQRQAAAWASGQRISVEKLVADSPELQESQDAILDLIYAEVCWREKSSGKPKAEEYVERFPKLAERISKLFEVHTAMRSRQSDVAIDTHSIAAAGTDDATAYGPVSPSTSDVALASQANVRPSPSRGNQPAKARRHAQRLGRFDLIERVGQGAFGTVWRARDTELKRDVAIKVPRQGLLDDEEQEQFLREARAAAQLKHPHIVAIHEVARDGETLYIVSDFIRGETLADRIKDQRPSVPEAVQLCITIAEALQHAHQAGVVHRDLKPGNIMLDGDGQPHVMDFGLAKRDAPDATMSIEGRILGTPAYMSPEQARGDSHRADRRSDVYSLGVILFELLTGERPFRGEVRILLQQILTEEPPSPRKLNPKIPRNVETICLKCLQKEPSRRYASTGEFAEELRRFVRNETIVARPVGRWERAWRWCKGHRALTGVGAVVAASLMFIAVLGAVIVKLQTKDGTLVVEVDQPDAKVQVLDAEGKVRITRRSEKGSINIAVDPGKHRLMLEKDGFAVYGKEFAMESGGVTTIHAILEPLVKAPPPAVADKPRGAEKAADPNRRAAEWLLGRGSQFDAWADGNLKHCTARGDLPDGSFEIRTIWIGYATVADRDLENLGELKALEKLDLGLATDLTDAGIARLTGLSGLKFLMLGAPRVSERGLAQLNGLPLTTMYLIGMGSHAARRNTPIHLLRGLQGYKELTRLALVECEFAKEDWMELGLLTGVEELALDHCVKFGDEEAGALRPLKELRMLRLRDTSVSNASSAVLQDLKSLRYLNLKATKFTDSQVAELKKSLSCAIEWDATISPNDTHPGINDFQFR